MYRHPINRGLFVLIIASVWAWSPSVPAAPGPWPDPGSAATAGDPGSGSGIATMGEVAFTKRGGLRDEIECEPPVGWPDHACPVGTAEGEWEQDPTCGAIEGGDSYNAGCDSPAVPPPFSPIACGETICGTWSTVIQGTTVVRDIDRYEIEFTQRTRMIVTITAEFDVQLGLISSCGTGACGMVPPWPLFWTAGGFYSAACNDPAMSPGGHDADYYSFDVCVEPGVWWVFVSGDWAQAPVDCADYVLTLQCQAPCHIPCCTGNDVCQHISYSECIYDEETCGPGHYGGSPQLDYQDCVPGMCAWGCSDAVVLECNSSQEVDNSVNSDVANPPMSCATGDSIGVLWFQFVAEAASVQIQTCNTVESDDSVFVLYEGDCLNYLTELNCSEDQDCEQGSWLGYICHYNPPLAVGQTYYVQFAAWQASSQGVYLLEVECPCPYVAPAACCLPDGSCTFLGVPECEDLGGLHMGAGTDCSIPALCNPAGACCFYDLSCVDSNEQECSAMGGWFWVPHEHCWSNPCSWLPSACCTYAFGAYSCVVAYAAACGSANQTFYPGEQCDGQFLFECPDYRICAPCADTTTPYAGPWECDDAMCQLPALDEPVQGLYAVPSDANPQLGGGLGIHRADDFVPSEAVIDHACWWGLYRDLAEPEPDPPPFEVSDDFTVTYYASDANLCPIMPPIASFDQGQGELTVTRTPTGERTPPAPYAPGDQVWIYEGLHDPVQVNPGECYWIEIVNNTDDGTGLQTRAWWWSVAPLAQGDGLSLASDGGPGSGYVCAQADTWQDHDLALCLNVPIEPCARCTAQACTSCRNHAAAGRLCLDLGLSGGVEPRLGGIQELDITVDGAAFFSGGVTVDCGPCAWDGAASAAVNGSVVTVTFDPALPDQCCCTVALACGAEVCVCGLEGDVDRGGTVTTGDASIIKPHFGNTPTNADAEFDFDVSGLISTADFSQVKPKFGNTIPGCP